MPPSPKAQLADPDKVTEREKASQATRLGRAQKYREEVHYPRYHKSDDWPPRKIKVEARKRLEGSIPFDVWNDGIHPSFGIGICSYFRMLRNVGLLAFVCGLLNLPSAVYFSSKKYSKTKWEAERGASAFELGGSKEESFLLANTAVCGDYEPVCLGTSCVEYAANCHDDDYFAEVRFAEDNVCTDYEGGTWVHEYRGTPILGHRDCELEPYQGYLDLAMTVIIIIALLSMVDYDRRQAVELKQESPDLSHCSLCVENPDKDALDPREWREYFEQFGSVMSVTVCIKNGNLLKLLHHKKNLEERVRTLRKPRVGLDKHDLTLLDSDGPEPCWSRALSSIGLVMLCPTSIRIKHIKKQISQLVDRGLNVMTGFGVSKVYVVFQKQRDMERAITYLNFFKKGSVDVSRAVSPYAVFYENLEVNKRWVHLVAGLSFAVMTGVCFGCYLILEYCLKHRYRVLVSLLVAVFSEIIPVLVYILVELERHHTVEGYENSYLLKSVPAHWFTACFAPWFISEFTEHNDTHVLYHIMDVLLLHAVLKPLVRALDPIGTIKRNLLSRFAATDAAANVLFVGKKWLLTKRFVDITTNLMLVLIYGSVMPLVYFVLALTCLITYWADKYCLFRINAELPPENEHLDMQIYFYLFVSVCIHILFTLWFYASWPFDQLCKTKNLDSDGLQVANDYGLDKGSAWELCDQDFYNFANFHTGEHAHWTNAQHSTIQNYTIIILVVIGLVVGAFMYQRLYIFFCSDEYTEAEKIACQISEANVKFDDIADTKEKMYMPHVNVYGCDEPMRCAYTSGQDFTWDMMAARKTNLVYDDSLQDISSEVVKRKLFSHVYVFNNSEANSSEENKEENASEEEEEEEEEERGGGGGGGGGGVELKEGHLFASDKKGEHSNEPPSNESLPNISEIGNYDDSIGLQMNNPMYKVYDNMGVSGEMLDDL